MFFPDDAVRTSGSDAKRREGSGMAAGGRIGANAGRQCSFSGSREVPLAT